MIVEEIIEEIREHAAGEFASTGKECCGLVIITHGKQRYMRCTNTSSTLDNFRISAQEQGLIRGMGELIGVVHSHPFSSPEPTEGDLSGCEETKVPWLIVNHPLGHFTVTEPSGYQAPLVGRQFVHGSNDCFGLIRDYYIRELGIELPNIPREDNWWNHGGNLYMDNYESAGFEKASGEPEKHDMLLLQLGHKVQVPNHAAIYLGDGKILHHLFGRLSTIEVWDGYWAFNTVAVMRHKKCIQQ